MKPKAIEVKDLTVRYGDYIALEEVNLTVYERDFFGIMGPNGGGKTTLLKAILGLIKPVKGSITLFGQSLYDVRPSIGYVPQFGTFDREFPISVWETVLTGRLSRRGVFHNYNQEDFEIAKAILDQAGIYDLRDKAVGSLSGGQKQRTFIARALVSQPQLLLLDEPTASVDIKAEEGLFELLKQLNETITIVVVTHDVGVISSYITNLACVNRKLFYHDSGEITQEELKNLYGCPVDLVAHGTPKRILKDH